MTFQTNACGCPDGTPGHDSLDDVLRCFAAKGSGAKVKSRAHVCDECKRIVSGTHGHASTCESREDPAGPVVKNW